MYTNDHITRYANGAQRYPDFIGIGAQKAGTTWLVENLIAHRDVFIPAIKEIQYFNHLYIREHRAWTGEHRRMHAERLIRRHLAQSGEKPLNLPHIALLGRLGVGNPSDHWYGSLFGDAGPQQICGEVTPEYSLLPTAGIRHLHRLNPHVRIIFCLRDPIDRAWSQLRMFASRNKDHFDFATAARSPDVILRADYVSIFDRWADVFGPGRIILLPQDDMLERPRDVMRLVCSFLGIQYAESDFPNIESRIHEGKAAPLPEDIYTIMKDQYRDVYRRMVDRFPWTLRWSKRHYEI